MHVLFIDTQKNKKMFAKKNLLFEQNFISLQV